jgi:hypothetical protein
MMNRSSTVFFKDSSRVCRGWQATWGARLVNYLILLSDFALQNLRVRLLDAGSLQLVRALLNFYNFPPLAFDSSIWAALSLPKLRLIDEFKVVAEL